jgi:hypothetical protein
MSIQLEIPEALFDRIKKNAIPFVDLTPVSVLERWANHFDKAATASPAAPTPEVSVSVSVAPAGRTLNPLSPPSLLHTRCRGTFGTVPFRKWNDLVRTAHVQAHAKAGSFESLLTVTHAQLRKGDHSGDSGFHFVPEIALSIQGVDANKAWEYSLRLAQYLKAPLVVNVEWRHKAGAEFPGETALLEWKP